MPITVNLTLTLADEQLDAIADRVAKRMGKAPSGNPLTVSQFAKAVNRSWPYIKNRVDAGIILKLDQPGPTMIPHAELERYRNGGSK